VILATESGIDVTTITAARIYKGTLEGQAESELAFENFPFTGLSKV
jgi:hypothetical protein